MKRTQLLSVLHNYADSLSSGLGFAARRVETDVYGEAAKCPGQSITVDFLKGTTDQNVSRSLQDAVALYRDRFPDFCARHGTSVQAYIDARATYAIVRGMRQFSVFLTDADGRHLSADYEGTHGRRIREVDNSGRFRRRALSTEDRPEQS